MNETYFYKLEFNKVLEIFSGFAKTSLGKKYCLELKPSFSKSKVEKLLNEAIEACSFYVQKGNLPICEFEDITSNIKKLNSQISLSAKELLEIAHILKLSRELKNYFYNDDSIDLSKYLILDDYFSRFYTNTAIENQIFTSIIDENTISDDASTSLKSLRNNRRNLENQIKDTLNNLIHSNIKALSDPIITIRNDRYVLPVKEEFRGSIKGFIHDISRNGSTVFIEPTAIFELNNRINTIKLEEDLEIEKILFNLSSSLFTLTNSLDTNMYLLTKLDFVFAKASFSRRYKCICPQLNDDKFINLVQARHPLIDENKVVPIDISVGKNYRSLIITGPNTGGKTVTLKTTGLLCLMAYSGLPIPANIGSSIYVFDNVFADIGDEQSIQESLSTFSAHIVNIVNILNIVTSNSLVLLDELGSGTDPLEGANLAISILEHFYNIGTITLATTHYQEIKRYALVSDGFENASCKFDVNTLKPTYELLIGVPGKSNAFAISKRLGLSLDILNRAKSLLNKEDVDIEELIKNIYDDKITIEKEKEETRKNLNQAEHLRKSLESEITACINKENEIISNAKERAKQIILESKEESNYTLKQINEIYANLKNSSLSKSQEDVKHANMLNSKLSESLNNLYSKDIQLSKESTIINKDDLKIGYNVLLNNIAEPAKILSISSKSAVVMVGNAKMNIKLSDIIKVIPSNNSSNKPNGNISVKNSGFKSKQVHTEINVIGQNIEEACFVIDKYLDDCAISKLSTVRIVHGKGTGKLREGIHKFLRTHPHVKSFRLGTFGEGEMGVTVVELK